jgi:hypothetical protein
MNRLIFGELWVAGYSTPKATVLAAAKKLVVSPVWQ